MAFENTILVKPIDLVAGEILKSKPHNTEAFELFEEGLVAGRFVKHDTGSIDMLDNSATPVIAGVSRRKLTSAIENNGLYTKIGLAPDQVAEVHNFGYVTVEVVTGQTPAKYGQVYAVNAAASGANFGKATTVSTNNVAVPGCVFWEQKAPDVWLVVIPKYLTGV
jgi:hypothetical protein